MEVGTNLSTLTEKRDALMLQFSTVFLILNSDWYLKDVGVDENSETMKKAKKFILDHGGI